MPFMPANAKCASLGCKNNRSRLSTFCLDHGGKDTYTIKQTKNRRDFNSMYDTKGWKSLRAAQLSRQPICQSCILMGHVRSAIHVDHVFSWSAIGKEAFFRNVFQLLCSECHSHKTALERMNVYRHYNGKEIDYHIEDYSAVMAMSGLGLEGNSNALVLET